MQPIRFQGQHFDVETGLHYNRFRYFDPDLGMFTTRDPIGLMGGTNVFQYAPNPTGWIDPFGLISWGDHLENTLKVPKPIGMIRAHAHHIVFKEGSELSKPILAKSKAILESHGIDWLMGRENFVWAPNRGHSVENAIRVLDALEDANNGGKGSKSAVVAALKRMGEHFADGSIENIPLRGHSVTEVKGKKNSCLYNINWRKYMSTDNFGKLVKDSVQFYFNLAIEKYPNLSSFAIVTDESYDTFIIAINTNGFYKDLKDWKITDEDYWNTAEWIEECLDCVYESNDIEQINYLINYQEGIAESVFLDACFKALKNVRSDNNSDVCMFVHLTDYGSSKKLLNIVQELNSKAIVESYKEYHSSSFK